MSSREPYVKPVVMQLHYSAEPEVAIAQTCKTTGSASGPAVSGCRREGSSGACISPGS